MNIFIVVQDLYFIWRLLINTEWTALTVTPPVLNFVLEYDDSCSEGKRRGEWKTWFEGLHF